MDIQTLEWHEGMAKKGREILEKIEGLSVMKRRIEKESDISIFTKTETGYGMAYDLNDEWGQALKGVLISIILKEIDNQIAHLKKEFAEL